MKTRNLTILIVLATLVVFAPSASSQYTPFDSSYYEPYRGMTDVQKVDKAWLEMLDINSDHFPDSSMVFLGDTILLPHGRIYVIGSSDGWDHMWRTAGYFVDCYVDPYLNPPVVQPAPASVVITDSADTTATANSNGNMPWYGLAIFAIILLGIGLWAWKNSRDQRKMKEDAEAAAAKAELAKKFVTIPPGFHCVSDDQLGRTATSAAQDAFGRNVQIVGEIERGYITGEQTMFNADGTSSVEKFDNEPGYRATVKFPDGTERLVVCKWACFNPCYSCKDAKFKGTFRPEGSTTAE